MFTSGEHKWQDCKTVVSAYCSVVDLQMGVIMDEIATGASTSPPWTSWLNSLWFQLPRGTGM